MSRYDENVTRANLSKIPNFRWCYYLGCGNGQIVNSRGAQQEWRCKKCTRMNCFDCKHEGHPGETCAQHEQLKPHRANNENEVRRISKRCPKNGCGRRIYKVAGCVHMFCDPRYSKHIDSEQIRVTNSVRKRWLRNQILLEMQGHIPEEGRTRE